MPRRAAIFAFFSALLVASSAAWASTNGLVPNPPMGYNSWYANGTGINEAGIRSVTDQMATNGMLAAGYNYINLDDGWAGGRDTNGFIYGDTNKFPSGMKSLADYVHSKGFKFGLYTTAGSNTCGGLPGSLNHLVQDVNTYAAWGVDYLKFEGCGIPSYEEEPREQIYLTRMAKALAACGRPIVYSSSISHFENWMPATINVWRGTGDITPGWGSILHHIDAVSQTPGAAGPGGWNDADVVPLGYPNFSANENASMFGMWCVLTSPLMTLFSGTGYTNILCNPDAIAVDQDPTGIQGVCVWSNNNLQVWRKPLGGSNSTTVAVALLNRGETNATITANWSDVGLPAGVATVYDIFARALSGASTNSYSASIPPHGIQFLRITGNQTMSRPPVGTNFASDLNWLADAISPVPFPNGSPYNKDQSASLTAMKLRGVNYTKGLGMIAYSKVSYFLGGAGTRFHSDIGLDDAAQNQGAVIFRVYLDGVKNYDSGILTTASAIQTIDLDLTGHNVITLEVTNGLPGTIDDYADWAGAEIIVGALPPGVPQSLSAAYGARQLNLSWSRSYGAVSYNVKRSTVSGGVYTMIGSTTNSIFSDTNTTTDVNYYYVVSAVNPSGESANSPEAFGTLPAFWTNTVTTTAQNWNSGPNWSNAYNFPNRQAALAIVNSPIQSNQNINLNQTVTVGALLIANTNGGGAFTISGNGGSMVFDNISSPASMTQTAGASTAVIAAPISMVSQLAITNNSANGFVIQGGVAGAGTVNKFGPGAVALGGTNIFAGSLGVAEGLLQIGGPYALGMSITNVIVQPSATADLNGFSVASTVIECAGTGLAGGGAIVNNSAGGQTATLQSLRLTADAWLGGSSRWDVRGPTNSFASGSFTTLGNPFNLNKVGANLICIADVNLDSALANIDVQQGTLCLEGLTTSLGNPSNTITIESGATLALNNTSTAFNKNYLFYGDGLTPGVSSISGSNVVSGGFVLGGTTIASVTTGTLAILGNLGGVGGLAKTGGGTLLLNLAFANALELDVKGGTLQLGAGNLLANNCVLELSPGTKLDISPLSSGLTLSNGQALGGVGTVAGNVTVGNSGIIAPSNYIGAVLTFSNSVTAQSGSTMALMIDPSQASNNQIRVTGHLALGGKLQIAINGSSPPSAGQSFKILDATNCSGGFDAIFPLAAGTNLLWDTTTLALDGTLRTVAGTLPQFSSYQLRSNILSFRGTGGNPNTTYYLLFGTNLDVPESQWLRVSTNSFDSTGNFSNQFTLPAQISPGFFRIQTH